MHRDKIEEALSKALSLLEEAVSMMTAKVGNGKALEDALWAASAETEYVVFLLVLGLGERPEDVSTKRSSTAKQSMELDDALTSAKEFLRSAKARVEGDRFEESYEAAWSARNLLLKAQELLKKKYGKARK